MNKISIKLVKKCYVILESCPDTKFIIILKSIKTVSYNYWKTVPNNCSTKNQTPLKIFILNLDLNSGTVIINC